MSDTKTIHFETHPVSIERKAELRAKGLTIIDAIFAPAESAEPADPAEAAEPAEAAKRARKAGKPAESAEPAEASV